MGEQQRAPFRNRVVHKLAKTLCVEHRFLVATSAWTNRTVERIMHEVIYGANAMLNMRGDRSARGLWYYRP